MIGSLVGAVVRMASLPLKVVNTGMDIATGGDGTKDSRKDIPFFGDLEDMSDSVSDTIQDEMDELF